MRSKAIVNAVAKAEAQENEVERKERFSVPVIVDKDKNLNYERHSWLMRILRVPIVLILDMLPDSWGKVVFTAFCGHRGDSTRVQRWATTHQALEVIYTFQLRRARGETGIMDAFWELLLSNARAIRNRLELAERELLTTIKEVRQRKPRVSLMSLGSGSARAVIETLSQLNGFLPVQTKLIDMSRRALNSSRELADAVHRLDQIEWHRDYAQNLERYCDGFQPDVVEMVGLLDYYPYEQAVDLVAKIYKVLAPGGRLITCNIRSNLERPFVTKAINWPMIYRSPQELADILVEAGFPAEHLKIVYEPLKIHGLAIAQKIA